MASSAADRSICLYHADSEQPTPYGYGLYGGADTRSLSEALRIAARREHEARS